MSLYDGPDDLHGEVRLPPFLAALRPLAPGSDILVPAVLLDLYPKSAARLQ